MVIINPAEVQAQLDVRDHKDSVRAATTAAGTLASDFENGDTVDGVVLATDDRVLLKNQASGIENGIYTVNASGAPTRASDFDTGAAVASSVIAIEEGTINAEKAYIVSSNSGSDVVGTDALAFVQFGGDDGDWTISGSNMFGTVSGDVGIGTGSSMDEKFHVAKSVDGGDAAMLIENSFANTAASTDETASLKFGFGGNNAVAQIAAAKRADFTSGANEDSAIDFYVRRDGTTKRVVRISAVDNSGTSGKDGRMLVGTDVDTANATLHVVRSGGLTAGTGNDTLLLQHSQIATNNCELTIVSPNRSIINFGDTSDVNAGMIEYRPGEDKMLFTVNTFQLVALTDPGDGKIRLGVGTLAPARSFDILENTANPAMRIRTVSVSNSALIELLGGTSATSGIRFGTTSSANEASIIYGNVVESMSFRVAGVDNRMILADPVVAGNNTLELTNQQATGDGCGILLRSGNTGISLVKFGRTSLTAAGNIFYFHSSNQMTFRTNGASPDHLVIDSVGNIGVGTDAATVDEKLHVADTVAGAFTGLLVENSTAADAGTDETSEIRFGFGGNNDAARITVGKISDYQSAANEDSFMSFSVDDGGTSSEAIRMEGDGGTKIGLYAETPVVQATKISDPSGGATVDAEARTAIDAIIDALEGIGVSASA